jgi:hypothetical protein
MDDPFSIPITLYRNCGYSMPILLQDAKGAPYPTDGYIFRLEIVPSAFDKSWASPPSFAQQNVAGSGSSGTVFVLDDADTAALDYKTAYTWRVLTSAPAAPPERLSGRALPSVRWARHAADKSRLSIATAPIQTQPITVKTKRPAPIAVKTGGPSITVQNVSRPLAVEVVSASSNNSSNSSKMMMLGQIMATSSFSLLRISQFNASTNVGAIARASICRLR